MNKKISAIALVVIFCSLFIQYQTYSPFQGNEPSLFDYSKVPGGYTFLRNESNVHSVAEYPIEKATETNVLGYYLSMQSIHQKPILNSALLSSPQDPLRSSIKNIRDPHTIKVLRRLGIDALVVHGVSASELRQIDGLTILYEGEHGFNRMPESHTVKKDHLVIAKINPGSIADYSLRFNSRIPVNGNIQQSSIDWEYEVPSSTKIENNKLTDASTEIGETMTCFDLRMSADGDSDPVSLVARDGSTKYNLGIITDVYKKFKLSMITDEELSIVSTKGHNMRISNIGCVSDEQ